MVPASYFQKGIELDGRKAFLFFGFMVLVWSIFWQGAFRIAAVRRSAQTNGNSPAASGLLVAL